MRVSDRKPERGRIFLMKGEPKTAKTTAMASFAVLGETYIFDIDQRIGWLNECPWIPAKNIEYDTYTDWNKVTKKLEYLENHNDFQNIILSSITSLSRATINTLFRNRGMSNLNTYRKNEKKEENIIGGIPIMGIAEYNGESSGLNIILTQLRIIHNVWKCNVFVEAHVVQGDMPQLDGSVKTFRRIVTGGNKVAAELPVYFDEIYHFYCNTDVDSTARQYMCHTRNNSIDFAGTAILNMVDKIDHTNESFYKIWSSYLPKDTTPKQDIAQFSSNDAIPDINAI